MAELPKQTLDFSNRSKCRLSKTMELVLLILNQLVYIKTIGNSMRKHPDWNKPIWDRELNNQLFGQDFWPDLKKYKDNKNTFGNSDKEDPLKVDVRWSGK